MKISAVTTLTIIGLFSSSALAFDDVPQQCQSVCSSLAQVSDLCEDIADSDNNQAYTSCVCNGQGASAAIPLCEACFYQEDRQTDPNDSEQEWRDNDANRLLSRCALPQASTYDLNAPSSIATVAAYTSVSNGSTVIPTSAPTTTATGPTSTGGNGSTSSTPSPTSTSTPNAAPMVTMAPQGKAFMAGAGLLLAAAAL